MVVGREQLGPDQHRVQAANEEKDADAEEVLDPDHLVVGREPEVAPDPAFVLADEPTGNLDAANGENVLKLIAFLRAQTGKTFIIATHDLNVAAHAGRIIRLLDGKIASIENAVGSVRQ